MAERPSRVDLLKRYLDQHADELNSVARSIVIDFGDDGTFTAKVTRIDRVKPPAPSAVALAMD